MDDFLEEFVATSSQLGDSFFEAVQNETDYFRTNIGRLLLFLSEHVQITATGRQIRRIVNDNGNTINIVSKELDDLRKVENFRMNNWRDFEIFLTLTNASSNQSVIETIDEIRGKK